MPDAPRKFHLITPEQLAAARQHWPQVSDKTWVLILRRLDEPFVLNKPPHRGIGFVTYKVPNDVIDGMAYRRDVDVLILVGGETPLAKL
jgi:hypothetical protein